MLVIEQGPEGAEGVGRCLEEVESGLSKQCEVPPGLEVQGGGHCEQSRASKEGSSRGADRSITWPSGGPWAIQRFCVFTLRERQSPWK